MSHKSLFNNTLIAISFIYGMLLLSCQNKNDEAQFYYWKQEVNLNETQKKLIDTLNSSKLYVKFFDISNGAPKAKVQFTTPLPNLEIIPCIYITNESIEQEKDIKNLAFKTNKLLQQIFKKHQIEVKEIQFDCDWTLNTKTKYFEFLEEFKALQNASIQITATLRLHQLKYPKKTGVPPVKKVLLMCYNLGDIQNKDEENSIFTLNQLENYLTNKTTYPLAMDFALPVFSWAVVYRFDHLALIINNISIEELNNNTLLEKLENNSFKVNKDHYFNNSYLYKDDIIRHEAVNSDVLKKISPLFKNLKNNNSQLLFFDLSNKNALNYTHEDYKNIISRF